MFCIRSDIAVLRLLRLSYAVTNPGLTPTEVLPSVGRTSPQSRQPSECGGSL